MSPPPTKADREKCYKARDDFWNCLSIKENEPEKHVNCDKLRNVFVTSCPSVWITHFDRRREYLKFKTKLEKGEI